MGYGATMGKQVFMLRWGFFSCWWTCETEQTFTHLLSCLPVTVQCTRDGQFVVVVARDATLPPIELDSIDLLETDDVFCTSVDSTSAFAIFQFPVTACGTTVTVGGGLSRQSLIWKYNLIGFITWTFFPLFPQEEDGFVVYENHMSSSYEVGVGLKGSITRDSHFEWVCQTGIESLIGKFWTQWQHKSTDYFWVNSI